MKFTNLKISCECIFPFGNTAHVHLCKTFYHISVNFQNPGFSSVSNHLKTGFYLPPSSLAGDYILQHVCVMQFSLKLLQLHIFGKLQVLMNFYALQYFLGLVNFGIFLSRDGSV